MFFQGLAVSIVKLEAVAVAQISKLSASNSSKVDK